VSYPTYLGSKFDASVTNLTFWIPAPDSKHDSLEINLSFYSPVTPTSTIRQSIPASYVIIYVQGDFDVDVYIDINGEWVSGDKQSDIVWEFSSTKGHGSEVPALKTWKIRKSKEADFTEINDRAEWGTVHFTGPADVHYESGNSALLRRQFSRTGTLKDVVDYGYRGIMQDEPVFAFSKSFRLGPSTANSNSRDNVIFTIGQTQDVVVQYASKGGLTAMKPLWASYFETADSLISFHYHDFDTANKLASNYSEQLAKDALKSGSEYYKDIVALSARQVLGALSFAGTPSNPLLFLKEISSNGDIQTVDVIFPAFPFFLYTNPRWLAYLLEPNIEYQLSGQYPNTYSLHDLGTFPNATGHPDGRDEYMPVEECGNMLIMGLAIVNSLMAEVPTSRQLDSRETFARAKNAGRHLSIIKTTPTVEDTNPFSLLVDSEGVDSPWSELSKSEREREAKQWVGRSHKLWKRWTGYLVREALIPNKQLSTDDFAGELANQTNLALKGIIGIRAMGEISRTLGMTEDAEYYRNISDVYIRKWEEYGLSRDGTHFKLAYTWYGSWSTLYNLFADSLLCFHLPLSSWPTGDQNLQGGPQRPLKDNRIPEKASGTVFVKREIYKMQSNWYHNVRQKYGLPLDSRHLYTKSDWELFAAAVSSKKVRDEIVQSVAHWINETATDLPMTDLYDTEGDGGFAESRFHARPVVGGHFSFLALQKACGGRAVAGLDFLDHDKAVDEVPWEKAEVADETSGLHCNH
jgi:Domain of unknown function (DUF1793)/Domain of unknown function (DUF4965)/Domain of unknown function (DUF5127)